MVAIGTRAGRQVTALITQMDQPLGRAVGHALEVKEALATLQGAGPADFQELVETVAAEMLLLGKAAADQPDAQKRVQEVIANGAALAKFKAFVAAQGGDSAVVDHPEQLPCAPVIHAVTATQAGYVQQIMAREIGLTCVDLGGGRKKKGDPIDYSVGILVEAKVGDRVNEGDLLCLIHATAETNIKAATERIQAAYTIGDQAATALPVLYERISAAKTALH
jgi:pyrimidine-nucleoside phosphorylase